MSGAAIHFLARFLQCRGACVSRQVSVLDKGQRSRYTGRAKVRRFAIGRWPLTKSCQQHLAGWPCECLCPSPTAYCLNSVRHIMSEHSEQEPLIPDDQTPDAPEP